MTKFEPVILRNYIGDSSIPVHYQSYTHDVLTTATGWTKKAVVGPEFYEPEATHHMYYDFDDLPPFATVPYQARERLGRFRLGGYQSVSGIVMTEGTNVKQAIKLHERGQEYVDKGYLIGPYFLEDQLIINAFKIFKGKGEYIV